MSINPLQMGQMALDYPVRALRGSGVARSFEPATRPASRDQVHLAQHGEESDANQAGAGLGEELANRIQKRDEALQALGQKIGGMKLPLETIVKNFPPFAQEDRRRIELLREYSAIRKEIDQLTFPPPPEIAKARSELALPAPLKSGATDGQIRDHLLKLDAVGAEIGAERAALAADTEAYLRESAPLLRISSPGRGGDLPPEELWSDSAAGRRSAEVGRQFALSVKQGVTVRPFQILKGMS